MSEVINTTIIPQSQTFTIPDGCACHHIPCSHTPPAAFKASPTDPFTANLLSVEVLRAMLVHITGKVKTVIDASVADRQQNKAMKDLAHQAIWDAYSEVQKWSWKEAQRIDGTLPDGEFWPLRFAPSVADVPSTNT